MLRVCVRASPPHLGITKGLPGGTLELGFKSQAEVVER